MVESYEVEVKRYKTNGVYKTQTEMKIEGGDRDLPDVLLHIINHLQNMRKLAIDKLRKEAKQKRHKEG